MIQIAMRRRRFAASSIRRISPSSSGSRFHPAKSSCSNKAGILGIQQSAWLASEYPKRITSHCAYERVPTKQIYVVDRESATALCNTRLDPIVRDHIDIVKPLNNVDDVSYIAFRQAFLNAVGRDDLHYGRPAGQLRVRARVKTAEWQRAEPAVRERGTGDHHCDSDCRDERTRTNYQIAIEAEPGHRFTSASLTCIAGPCGGWLAVLSERIEADGRRAVGSFDVWSRPTTWRLTATQEKVVDIERNVETTPQELIYGRTIEVRVPKDAVAADIIIQTEDSRTLTTPVAAPSPNSGLQLLEQRSEGGEIVYGYKVGPRP